MKTAPSKFANPPRGATLASSEKCPLSPEPAKTAKRGPGKCQFFIFLVRNSFSFFSFFSLFFHFSGNFFIFFIFFHFIFHFFHFFHFLHFFHFFHFFPFPRDPLGGPWRPPGQTGQTTGPLDGPRVPMGGPQVPPGKTGPGGPWEVPGAPWADGASFWPPPESVNFDQNPIT